MSSATQSVSRHTPGPWRVHGTFRTVVVPEADVDKAIGGSVDPTIDARDYAKIIAWKDGDSKFPEFTKRLRPAEAVANARLIAAAPDLLAALIVARQHLLAVTGLVQHAEHRAALIKATAQVEAAITKADGAREGEGQ